MTNNDVLRSIRFILKVNDSKMIEILSLDGCEVSQSDIAAYLKKDDEIGYKECSDEILAHFLNGLIIFKRGRDESKPIHPIKTPVTNNIILKKLRVAFMLKDSDIISLIEKSGLQVSKNEFSAFFRKEGHRNYRECGDQFLRNLLKGLVNLNTL